MTDPNKDSEAHQAAPPPSQAQPTAGPPEVDPARSAREMPAFAEKYPDDPQLRALVEAFERGQYKLVREQAPKLAQATDNPLVAKAAHDLRRRLDPDPLSVKMLIGAAALLVLLSVWAYVVGR
jgi:hypothetical protein